MDIKIDSRKIKAGDLFFCLEKNPEKAGEFIKNALENGAKCAYTTCEILHEKVVISRDVWADLGAKLREIYPEKPSKILAITGTNGKTSTAFITAQILQKLGKKCIYIGTIGVFTGNSPADQAFSGEFSGENLTTPDIATLHKILHIAKQKMACDIAIFEASSHGIEQNRIDFLEIFAAGFTNFTQDHLDYHKTMDEYFTAKSRLFSHFISQNGWAITNSDSQKNEEILQKSRAKNSITYGKNGDLRLVEINLQNNGQEVKISYKNQNYSFFTGILGDFQVYNILCAIAFAISLGCEIPNIIRVLSEINPPPGRLQRVKFQNNYTNIYIDYAHTPDALQKALSELRKIAKNRLIVVFGCGGDRDPGKRPIMGKIAVNIADVVIITDDNPRSENPEEIRRQIINGIREFKENVMQNLKVFPDKKMMLFALQGENVGKFLEITSSRQDAIRYAIENSDPDDVILIAGKGHENYQIIGTTKHHFSDEEEVLGVIISAP